MNNNLYVNVNELLVILDCMRKSNNNAIVRVTLDEVESTIHDLKWREIKDEQKTSA